MMFRWEPPLQGIKCNTDGSYLKVVKKGGYGFAFRDVTGKLLSYSHYPIESCMSPFETETESLDAALRFILSKPDFLKKAGQIDIELDCLNLVKAIKGSHRAPLYLEDKLKDDVILKMIQENLEKLRREFHINIDHEPRRTNWVADFLSLEGRCGSGGHWDVSMEADGHYPDKMVLKVAIEDQFAPTT